MKKEEKERKDDMPKKHDPKKRKIKERENHSRKEFISTATTRALA